MATLRLAGNGNNNNINNNNTGNPGGGLTSNNNMMANKLNSSSNFNSRSNSVRGSSRSLNSGGSDSSTNLKNLYKLWESSAILSEREIDKVMELSDLITDRPMPADDKELFFSRTNANNNNNNKGNSNNISTTGDALHRMDTNSLLHHSYSGVNAVAQETLNTANEFFGWFSGVKAAMESQQETAYRNELHELQTAVRRCDSMLHNIDLVKNQLNMIEQQHTFVSDRTESIHTACKSILQEQKRLQETSDDISKRLKYFTEFERCALRLNSSKISVQSPTFLPLLRDIDSSITYLSKHQNAIMDAGLYLLKFKNLQSKALVLVKMHVYDVLKSTTQELRQQILDSQKKTLQIQNKMVEG